MKPTIKAFVFDAYGTLFDVHSVVEKCNEYFPGKGVAISQTWRQKQIEYSFLRELMGNYDTFLKVTKDSLHYAVAFHNEEFSEEIEQALIQAYFRLNPYPEVVDTLKELRNANKKLAIFSNGSHDMLDPLVENSGLSILFHEVISVDEIKKFKPTVDSYQHATNILNVKPEEVLFMSSNGWDITGAKNFGFNTSWINRNKLPIEVLDLDPNEIYRDLTGILEWK